MNYPKVLTIQDVSCVGQCSLTVALPIISACGVETCILPSAVLSTHTCGFTGFTCRDLTDDVPAIAAHWKKEGITFDAVYTGYLGSTKQIDYVRDIMRDAAGSLKIVDPAMADGGKLYPAFDGAYVAAMRALYRDADVVLPNITEAALLCGMDYRETYDRAYIDELLRRLTDGWNGTVVLTGVSYAAGKTGVVTYQNGSYHYYEHEKLPTSYHGTGDVYASAFTGILMRDEKRDVSRAAALAAQFVLACIKATVGDDNHKYGVKFETALPQLWQLMQQ